MKEVCSCWPSRLQDFKSQGGGGCESGVFTNAGIILTNGWCGVVLAALRTRLLLIYCSCTCGKWECNYTLLLNTALFQSMPLAAVDYITEEGYINI